MAEVALVNLTKRFGSVVAVDRVNLLIKDREFFTILGPSGAGKTTIYLTHNLPDAVALSDRIAIMSQGKFEQINTPKNIYQFPANDFVRDFIESAKVSLEL